MSNPIFDSRSDGQQAGVSPANPINDPNFNSRQGSNTFDLSYQNLLTARFGEITPFFYMSSIGRDRIELRSSQDLRTYTLGAPLMSQVRMKKSYFSVPMKAIMPNTWDYLFVNPVKGNDVPADAYSYLDMFKFGYWISLGLKDIDVTKSPGEALNRFLLLYVVFSKGSLLDYLGISLSQYVSTLDYVTALSGVATVPSGVEVDSLDRYFDLLISGLVGSSTAWSVKSIYTFVDPSTGSSQEFDSIIDNNSSLSDVRAWFYNMIEHPDSSIVVTGTAFTSALTSMKKVGAAYYSYYKSLNSNPDNPVVSLNVNLYKVVAYQMAVSQFYTNDHVDSVYSSDLWISNMRGIISEYWINGATAWPFFTLNGVRVLYDIFSANVLNSIGFRLSAMGSGSNIQSYFFYNLFSYRRSLRFGDYFNSSRPQPLAVGDVNVPVVGNNVSIIDVNKNLHVQRFLNAANRIGSNIVDYAKGIFGYTPQAVDPRPSFISSEYVVLGTDEIDNTAESQGTVNTNLVSQNSQYAFDVTISDPCIILGLCSFEVLGAYPYTIERDNFHKDRYDMFNPFLQHIGDQEVKSVELGIPVAENLPFGYQVRYAEYKFKYPQQHGGFNDISLKLWSMPYNVPTTVLSEDFIRDYPAEFDKFYKSLQFSSLANYFHFQISFMNSVRANRAMDFQPTLLG